MNAPKYITAYGCRYVLCTQDHYEDIDFSEILHMENAEGLGMPKIQTLGEKNKEREGL